MVDSTAHLRPAHPDYPNLRPWQPGQSGNPKGRPKALGASLAEWYSLLGATMHEQGGKPYLRKIVKDELEPYAKRQAATELLDSLTKGHAKSGKPFRADARDAIHDRTVGKPQQQIDVVVTDETPLAAIRERFAALLAASPDGAAVLAAVAGRVGLEPKALPEAPDTPPEGPPGG